MTKLIDPDLGGQAPATLHEGVDHTVTHKDNERAGSSHGPGPVGKDAVPENGNNDHRGGVHADMPEQHAPVLSLEHDHPLALEGEVPEEVGRAEQQNLERERRKREHGISLVHSYNNSPINAAQTKCLEYRQHFDFSTLEQ